MADIVSSLFGLTPLAQQVEEYNTSRDLELGNLIATARLNQYAPPERQRAYLAQQGAQAALVGKAIRGIGGLFGMQDPQLQRATQLEGILGQTQQELGADANNPAVFYPELQRRLAEGGFGREAMQVGQVAQKAIQDYGVSQATKEAQKATALEKMTQSQLNLAKTKSELTPKLTTIEQLLEAKDRLKTSGGDVKAIQAVIDKETQQAAPSIEEAIVALSTKKAKGTINEEEIKQLDYLDNFKERIGRASRSVTNVNMGDKGRELILEKVDIPIVNKFAESAEAARTLARDSRVIANLLKGAQGGKVIKLSTQLAKDLGLENERITANDLANSLATRGAVNIRAVGSGSTSDLEFKAYLEAYPSLANSESGREIIAKYAEKLADRQEKLADYSRKLVKQDKFSQEALAQYDNSLGSMLGEDFYNSTKTASPLVPISRLSPQTQQYLNKRK